MKQKKLLTILTTGAIVNSLAEASDIIIRPYNHIDLPEVKEILGQLNWPARCVEGQLRTIDKLYQDEEGEVFVAVKSNVDHSKVMGLIQVQHYRWNQLSFIHGLYVGVNFRRQGVAHRLISHVEELARNKEQRGIFLDTPVDNKIARLFYEECQYQEAYIMPDYYEKGLDGITYQKWFKQ